MSRLSLRVTLSVCAVCAMVCGAAGRAAPAHEQVELAEVLGRAVCPIRVEIDDDPNRIPRRIKMLKCAHTPNPVCQQENMVHACCRRHHHTFSSECVEVTDHVLVSFRDGTAPVPVPVSVGCTCMFRESTPAVEDS